MVYNVRVAVVGQSTNNNNEIGLIQIPKRYYFVPSPYLQEKMKFNVGDKISFLNEKGQGEIISFPSKKAALILRDDGFEIPYPMDQLALVVNEKDLFNPGYVSQKDYTGKKNIPSKEKKKINDYLEVDLHIHELTNATKHMSNSKMLDIQLRHCILKLNYAIENGIKKVVFIHGVGEGVLRNEIRNILKTYDNIEFFDGRYSTYGYGATEVRIK